MDEKKEITGVAENMSPEDREIFENMTPQEQEMAQRMAEKMSQEKSKNATKNKDSDGLSAEEHRELVASMLPGGNVKPLFESETCLLCKENAKKRTCYAVTDMGNKQPEGTKPTAILIRVKTKIGSIVPLQIACCDQCKKNHRKNSLMVMLTMLITLALGLFVLSRPSVNAALYSMNKAMSFIIFLVLIPASYGLGLGLRKSFRKKADKETIFNVSEIPFIAEMEELGWFPLNTNAEKEPTLIFSKEKLKSGWFID